MSEVATALITARRLYEERRRRDRLLGHFAILMGEPNWDLLLTLFTEHDQGEIDPAPLDWSIDRSLVAQSAAVLARLGLVKRRSGAVRAIGTGALELSPTGLTIMTRVLNASGADVTSIVDR